MAGLRGKAKIPKLTFVLKFLSAATQRPKNIIPKGLMTRPCLWPQKNRMRHRRGLSVIRTAGFWLWA